MDTKYHSVVLFVRDIEKAKAFYCSFMAMEIDMDLGTNVSLKNGMALWQVHPDHVIPRTVGPDLMQGKGNRFELYFETEDLEEFRKKALAAKVGLVHDVLEEPWGQMTMRIYDPEGTIIEVAETMQRFLSRLKESGMTVEQIARKSGMKPEDVVRSMGE